MLVDVPRIAFLPRLGAFACGLLLAGPAAAEIRPIELNRPETVFGPNYSRSATHFHLETGLWTGGGGDVDRQMISPLLRIVQRVHHNEAEMLLAGAVYSRTGPAATDPSSDISQNTLRSANPYLAYYWVWRTLPRQIRLGLGAGLPLALLRDEEPDETVLDLEGLDYASQLRGRREMWLWSPETSSAVLHADYYRRHGFGLVWGGQLNLANMWVMTSKSPDEGYQLGAELDLEAAYELTWARFELEVTYATAPLSSADDVDQISVEPELRFRTGLVDLVARFTVNIDAPAGMAFDEGKVFGMHFGMSSPTERVLPKE